MVRWFFQTVFKWLWKLLPAFHTLKPIMNTILQHLLVLAAKILQYSQTLDYDNKHLLTSLIAAKHQQIKTDFKWCFGKVSTALTSTSFTVNWGDFASQQMEKWGKKNIQHSKLSHWITFITTCVSNTTHCLTLLKFHTFSISLLS